MRNKSPSISSPRKQRGAVLYIALIMLILMALIGIVGMQVTNLQERMSANYRGANLAFQTAELDARNVEAKIGAALTTGARVFSADQEVCAPSFDPESWADGITVAKKSHTRRIDRCFAASSRRIGAKENEETGNIYEITALSSDDDTNPTATAVINTIFIP